MFKYIHTAQLLLLHMAKIHIRGDTGKLNIYCCLQRICGLVFYYFSSKENSELSPTDVK